MYRVFRHTRANLPEQVALLGRHARPAEDGEGVGAVLRLDALDLRRDPPDRLVVGDGPEPLGPRRVAEVGAGQPVVVRALQVAADALGAEHALVEREVLPRLEADDLVVLDLELDAALLAAEAAVRLDQPVGIDGRVEPLPGLVRLQRAELRQQFRCRRRASVGHCVARPPRFAAATPASLGEGQHLAPAGGADPLVVSGRDRRAIS